jgi:hypothetical protein
VKLRNLDEPHSLLGFIRPLFPNIVELGEPFDYRDPLLCVTNHFRVYVPEADIALLQADLISPILAYLLRPKESGLAIESTLDVHSIRREDATDAFRILRCPGLTVRSDRFEDGRPERHVKPATDKPSFAPSHTPTNKPTAAPTAAQKN